MDRRSWCEKCSVSVVQETHQLQQVDRYCCSYTFQQQGATCNPRSYLLQENQFQHQIRLQELVQQESYQQSFRACS